MILSNVSLYLLAVATYLVLFFFEFSKYGIVAHSPTNINFNLTPTEEGLSPKRLGLLTFLAPFVSFIEITLAGDGILCDLRSARGPNSLFAKNFPLKC